MKGRFRQWYHTSGDTTDKSDSTQFKRVVVISAATAVFLANAGPAECERMMGEVGSRIWGRLGLEKGKTAELHRREEEHPGHPELRLGGIRTAPAR